MLVQARALAAREAEFFRRVGVDGFVCWFAKLPPHDVDGFYTLSPADMAGFGIGEVEIQVPGSQPPDDVQRITVDWAALQASRPATPSE